MSDATMHLDQTDTQGTSPDPDDRVLEYWTTPIQWYPTKVFGKAIDMNHPRPDSLIVVYLPKSHTRSDHDTKELTRLGETLKRSAEPDFSSKEWQVWSEQILSRRGRAGPIDQLAKHVQKIAETLTAPNSEFESYSTRYMDPRIREALAGRQIHSGNQDSFSRKVESLERDPDPDPSYGYAMRVHEYC